MLTFKIYPKNINYKKFCEPENDYLFDMLYSELSLNDALELIIETITNELIGGAEIVRTDTGEILFTFENSPIPTYNATDIKF